MTNIVIPDNVAEIGASAFAHCGDLTSVTMSNSIEYIGKEAFYGCDNIKNVYYDGDIASWCGIEFETEDANPIYFTKTLNIKEDGEYQPIANIIIPDGVTEIKSYAFYNLSSLETISIPTSVVHIGYNAFYGCENLQYSDYGGANYLGNENNPYVVLVEVKNANRVTSFDIKNETKIIYTSALSYCSIKSIVIPDSVTCIGNSAFSYCSSLTKVTIGKNLVYLNSAAFYNCFNLNEIVFSQSIKKIGSNVFGMNMDSKDFSITFQGTKSQWIEIDKGDGWDHSIRYVIHCTDGDLTAKDLIDED